MSSFLAAEYKGYRLNGWTNGPLAGVTAKKKGVLLMTTRDSPQAAVAVIKGWIDLGPKLWR